MRDLSPRFAAWRARRADTRRRVGDHWARPLWVWVSIGAGFVLEITGIAAASILLGSAGLALILIPMWRCVVVDRRSDRALRLWLTGRESSSRRPGGR